MKPKICIACTAKSPGPLLSMFITHHVEQGIEHIYLFNDGGNSAWGVKNKHVTEISADESLKSYDNLTTFPTYKSFVKDHVMARQILNTELAMNLARQEGFDWLIHIDIDELLFFRHRNCQDFFEQVPKEVGQISFLNQELAPHRIDIANPFVDGAFFKHNPASWTKEQLSVYQKISKKKSYFVGYVNGKSAVSLAKPMAPSGVHGFAELDGGFDTLVSYSNAYLIHYINYSFEHFFEKYKILGNFPDKWWDKVDAGSEFHRTARDFVTSNDHESALALYKNEVLFDDSEREQLVELGLLRMI